MSEILFEGGDKVTITSTGQTGEIAAKNADGSFEVKMEDGSVQSFTPDQISKAGEAETSEASETESEQSEEGENEESA